jgi:CDP-4-dehydro-6-deoxyglucose reductase, E1
MLPESLQRMIREYAAERFPKVPFQPGVTPIPPSGKSFDHAEFLNMVEAVMDGWWTEGRFTCEFERRFAAYLGRNFCAPVNSGSSANLLALTALTSRRLGERRLKKGDEVITVAAGFPTTITPIIQNGLVPVFIDISLDTYNLDVAQLEAALSPKTKAVMIAHTLGNPWPAKEVVAFCKAHNLWLIEDACDALGSTIDGMAAGTIGDISTFSFYPAHHMTMGEGGAVATNDALINKSIRAFRDWGRDCWCKPGTDNTCGIRYEWALGNLPKGYDHKYIYSEVGYNLKITDMQAALGLAQMDKLEGFGRMRRANHAKLRAGLAPFESLLRLPNPTPGSDPSWFGFLITVRPDAPFTRDDIVKFLNARKIGTRFLFAGNMTRQPIFTDGDIPPHRVVGDLARSDDVMTNTFWIGCHPALSEEALDYVIASFDAFCRPHLSAWSGKTVLVTGASGFIGTPLVAELRRLGATVVPLTLPPGDQGSISADITDADALKRGLEGKRFDAVFHLAVAGANPNDPQSLFRVNAEGTEHLLAALEALPPCPVVVAGSWTEYGAAPTGTMTEETLCTPQSPYGISKLSSTLTAVAWAKRLGRPLTVLRLFSVYGAGEAAHRLGPTVAAAFKAGQAPRLSSPESERDFVCIDDVVSAFIRAADLKECGRILNVGTGVGTTLRAFVDEIRRRLGSSIEPEWGASVLRPWDVPAVRADIQSLKTVMGWVPEIDVHEGIRRMFVEKSPSH